MASLPAISFLLTVAVLTVLDPHRHPGRVILRAVLVTGVWVVVVTEGLSLVGGVTQAAVAAAWLLPILAMAGWLAARRRSVASALRQCFVLPEKRGQRALWAGIALIPLVTAVVGALAPPNTWDSLNYHMPRVAHWAQQRSIDFFPTGIEVQNSRTPFAEYAVLHLYVLSGGDRWVNFVAWSAMVGSIAGAAALARQFGFGRPAPVLAAAYAASIPMGIIQATSTMTDAVVALWLVAAASEVLEIEGGHTPAMALFFAGVAAGLAVLTKPTAVPYLLPLGLLALARIRGLPVRRAAPAVAAGVAAVLVLNLGHWTRSVRVYGDPVSGGDQLSVHGNQATGARGLVSNVVRNLGLHVGTPLPHVNKALTIGILRLHEWIGIDPNDPRTTAHGRFEVDETTTNEDKTGNLVHLLVASAASISVLTGRTTRRMPASGHLVVVAAGFVLFCWIFKWQIFGSRYHLPFFVLLAPVVGGAIARGLSARGGLVVGWTLLIGAVPWLVGTGPRPLLPLPGESRVESVLTGSRSRLLFANGPYLLEPYRAMTEEILRVGCGGVGLSLLGNEAEYPLWALLRAPRQDLRIEWIVAGSPSARLRDRNFAPCAVICEGCAEQEVFGGLPLVRVVDGFRLFLATEGE